MNKKIKKIEKSSPARASDPPATRDRVAYPNLSFIEKKEKHSVFHHKIVSGRLVYCGDEKP